MSVLNISEHSGGSSRLRLPENAVQDVQIQADECVVSEPFKDGTGVIVLHATGKCRFNVGQHSDKHPLQVDVDSGISLAANETREYEVTPGLCLAVIGT